MAVKTKRVSVTKRPTEQQLKNHERWEFFLSQCAIPWYDLSEESKDFFCEMGRSIESSAEDINNAVDAAILKDEKK